MFCRSSLIQACCWNAYNDNDCMPTIIVIELLGQQFDSSDLILNNSIISYNLRTTMHRYHTKPIIKQPHFIITLILGIICITTSIILFIIVCTHLQSCVAWNACIEESSGYYSFCVQDGYKYCCGGWGLDTQSCGNYVNNCRRKDSGYIDCGNIVKAEGILGLISMVILIALIAMVCLHKKQKQESQTLSLVMRPSEGDMDENRNQRLINQH